MNTERKVKPTRLTYFYMEIPKRQCQTENVHKTNLFRFALARVKKKKKNVRRHVSSMGETFLRVAFFLRKRRSIDNGMLSNWQAAFPFEQKPVDLRL